MVECPRSGNYLYLHQLNHQVLIYQDQQAQQQVKRLSAVNKKRKDFNMVQSLNE